VESAALNANGNRIPTLIPMKMPKVDDILVQMESSQEARIELESTRWQPKSARKYPWDQGMIGRHCR
jgi:hypothetical protein